MAGVDGFTVQYTLLVLLRRRRNHLQGLEFFLCFGRKSDFSWSPLFHNLCWGSYVRG